MDFWNEQRVKEALPEAKLYNFPPNWSANGLVIWHEDVPQRAIVLARRKGEDKGITTPYLKKILDKTAAIICTDSTEYFQYNKPIIEIKTNTNLAITDCARYIRKCFNGKVCAVTGSSGKTTTTQILYNILSANHKVSANLNKANTTWGISWNMCCFDIDADYWVIETSLGGGMARNAAITKPNYAIITNIAPVHLAKDMTFEDIAHTKSKIFNNMQEGDTAIIYREAAYFDILKNAAEYKKLKIITFGESEDCTIRISAGDENKFFINGCEYTIDSAPLAKHILLDMAAAIAIASEENIPIEEVLNTLKSFTLIEGRGAADSINLGEKQLTLIDESYNANPLSMKAAIEGFGKLYADKNKILILGDMAQCGPDSPLYHRDISKSVREITPKKVILCGNDIKNLYEEIRDEFNCMYFQSVDDLNQNILELLEDNDYIMIKSSHSSELYKTVEVIKKAGS